MPAREIDFASADGISWSTAIAFTIFHVLAVVALFFATWDAVLVALVLHWMCIGWGIGLGYHRLHTHRSYKTPRIVEYFFAICATMTLQGGPIFWTALHRIHHQKSEPRRRPAHAARRQVVVAHAVDHLRRGAARRYREPGEVLAPT